MKLDAATGTRFARIALGHVTREYPHKLDHVLHGDEDAAAAKMLHPIFFGSFDWHSCVHGWWSLLTLRQLFPEMKAADIVALADQASPRTGSRSRWPISTGHCPPDRAALWLGLAAVSAS